ncbi:MAG TPA: AAA family ATPase, partial [Salinarimonas sp.]|nr:AAA family ATPase [Salinarimonas sp.]
MRPRLRVFISSPGDVPEERLRAHLVVQKLARDYARFFQIEPYLWEHEPMLASGHFQDAIEPPSECDVVVLVVYARLGTALPERTTLREYRGIDGRAPVTGTEWEFEEALAANRSGGAPDLLAYRKLGDPGASLVDAERRAEQERQWTALESFWRRHFEGAGIFLAGSAKFRTLEEFDQKLESDLKTLIEGKIAERMREQAGLEDAHWFRGSPFRGLAAYDFDDAPVFFGRDAQIRAAMTRLHGAARGGTAFLLVLGASGSGKSSLVRAGLLPALVAPKAVPGVGVWRRVVLRPGDGGEDPVLGLAKALVAGQADAGEGLPELLFGGGDPKALAAHLQAAADDPSFPFQQALSGVADRARSAGGLLPFETAKLVLVIDQLEELFTRAIDPERRALFARILAGLARSGAVWVVGTMRNDLWHRAAELPQLVGLVEAGARLDLPQPDGAEVIEIVRRPAAAAGIAFESDPESGVGLDAVMARAANEEPGALPLLSVMLDSLYERDVAPGAGRMLTFASYRELGELRGAIARRAEQTLAALRASDPEAAAALPQLLRALVTASGEGTATSRPADLAGFPPGSPAARLIEAFVAPDARLLVTTMSGGRAEVRLAHEALLENWPAARDQIATDRRDLQTRARLEALHGRWNAAGGRAERKDALLTGLNLAEGADLVRRWGIPRDTGLGAFVAQSQAAERWRRQSLAAAAVVLLAVFAAIAGLATLQWQRAERQTLLARQAEDTEREARAGAEAARTEAVAERDRADREKTRALAALRETKREAARSLALQSTLATGRDEVRRGLTLAVQAARAERDVLDPGETPASEPALLGALGEMREVAHLVMPPESWTNVPHDFLGDTRLVVADPQNGVTVLDLETRGTVLSVKLPERVLPTAVRALPEAGLIVAAGVRTFFVIDAATGAMRGEIAFKDRIADLDVHEGSRKAVVAVGVGIGIIDLAAPALPELVP